MAEKKVVWFARARGIGRAGPYKTQMEAAEAIMMPGRIPAPEAFVWPEEVAVSSTPSPHTSKGRRT